MHKVAVFGLGRFGASVAGSLYAKGAEVLAIDRSLKLVEQSKDEVSVAVACDATDLANLQAYDVGNMDVAVVAIGTNFEASVLVTLLCRELGVGRIVAKALNPLQAKVLVEVGADRVVMPEEEMGSRLAEHLLHERVVDFVELPPGFSLRRVKVPSEWAGQCLSDLRLLGEQKLNLIQIVRGGEQQDSPGVERIPLPCGETVLLENDLIDVIGPDKALLKLMP